MGGRCLAIWSWVVGVLVTLPLLAQEASESRPAEARLVAGSVSEIVLLDGAINMLASVGEDGVLLVDTGYAATADDAAQALDRLHVDTVRVIVNTHGDPDHVGGNVALGPDALVISHPGARRQAGTYFALPVIDDPSRRGLAIADEASLYFNGELIRLLPIPGGHTAGDVVVHFTGSGVAAFGDIVLTGTFPDADPRRGGDAQRLVQILERLERELPADTIVVPGHGDTLRADELDGYIAMIEGSMAAVRSDKAAGRSFDEMLARNSLAPWSAWERADEGLSFADWGGQIWASLGGERPRSICGPMTESLMAEGIEPAIASYRRLKETEADRWDLDENQLNTLGYQLLQRGMVAEAVAVFELNVESFPEASNSYDSLGEAYMTAGDNARAIASYRRSLELDPGNANAIAMLDRLNPSSPATAD